MDVTMLTDIREIDPAEFDALDTAAGAVACHARLQQRQEDGRWRANYLRAVDSGALKAVIPLYASRGKSWPDLAYDASSWPLPAGPDVGRDDEACLLVGGCSGGRSSLHVERETLHPTVLREFVAEVARFAVAQNRSLVFPFMSDVIKAALSEATSNAITWVVLRREAQLRGVNDARWERSLGSRAYGVLRRDRKLIAAAEVDRSVRAWPEVEDEASKLIADHNSKKGTGDHPEFVRFRYAEWQQCEGVDLIVFTASSLGVSGVLTALVWKDELELCEIGLAGDEGPRRLAAYLDLLFHSPLAFARSRGLRNIRAGFAAEVPKKSRGAVFEDLHGGLLDFDHTRRLAADES